MRIFLIGYMGCGKTSVGEKLAKKLNFEFYDTDKAIETKENQSINHIFKTKGENHFRELEKELLPIIASKQNVVISTGGGFPCHNSLMSSINELGLTIYLKTSSIELAKRLSESKQQRPLLKQIAEADLEPFIRKQLEIRNPFYSNAQWVAVGKEQRVNRLFNRLLTDFPNLFKN